MAKDFGGWLGKSKAVHGNATGGGSVGKASSGAKAGMGKKDGGQPQSGGPTPFGNSSGGGSGPKGKEHALIAPKGIGLKGRGLRKLRGY